jgi:hypothetical protein
VERSGFGLKQREYLLSLHLHILRIGTTFSTWSPRQKFTPVVQVIDKDKCCDNLNVLGVTNCLVITVNRRLTSSLTTMLSSESIPQDIIARIIDHTAEVRVHRQFGLPSIFPAAASAVRKTLRACLLVCRASGVLGTNNPRGMNLRFWELSVDLWSESCGDPFPWLLHSLEDMVSSAMLA